MGRRLRELHKQFAGVREDGGDPGPHRVALVHGDLTHPHPGDVGDGVPGAGSEDTGRHTEIAGPRPRLGLDHAGHPEKAQDHYDELCHLPLPIR